MELNQILHGDVSAKLREIPDEFVHQVITSPPYWGIRDYKFEGQIGLEPSFQDYINKLLEVFDEVKRVLRNDGTCWIVMGDTYSTNAFHSDWSGVTKHFDARRLREGKFKKRVQRMLPLKSLCMIPARFAIGMLDRGWLLRNDIIWRKNNCIPSSVKDRYTVDYEHVFFFSKSKKYYFKTQYEPYSQVTLKEFGQKYQGKNTKDYKSHMAQNPSDVKRRIIAGLKMPPIGGIKKAGGDNPMYSGNTPDFAFGRIARSVWTTNTQSFPEAHFSTFPEKLVAKMISAGCPENGIILDCFIGAGTTALVALKMNRNFLGIEAKEEYITMSLKRIDKYLKQTKLM